MGNVTEAAIAFVQVERRKSHCSDTAEQRISCTLHWKTSRAILKRMPGTGSPAGVSLGAQVLAGSVRGSSLVVVLYGLFRGFQCLDVLSWGCVCGCSVRRLPAQVTCQARARTLAVCLHFSCAPRRSSPAPSFRPSPAHPGLRPGQWQLSFVVRRSHERFLSLPATSSAFLPLRPVVEPEGLMR